MSSPSTAAAAVSRTDIVRLYRALLTAGRGFADYNFRAHARRRVVETFREERDPGSVAEAYAFGVNQLGVVRRQATISRMYEAAPLVIESPGRPPAGGAPQ
ncbi:hypothetical protein BU14_2978s0001 [Porphyra umbilicalis]|uniref:Complex 1 LYR protein domain-containing protein n=1 Tax=Porphyra umbilicalis TaxID=2786 RepID=A0A1X6NI91_PORUM|nr:hypothetical protein BU14_2978s0001 [Porphyra umbilicalis]|eukprot:OSX68337.1 hypothetical protein BU14_2978s0001 [Porphyra umbilicalis]